VSEWGMRKRPDVFARGLPLPRPKRKPPEPCAEHHVQTMLGGKVGRVRVACGDKWVGGGRADACPVCGWLMRLVVGEPYAAGTTLDAPAQHEQANAATVAERALAALRTVEVKPGDVLAVDACSLDGWVEYSALEALVAAAPDGAVVRDASGDVWRAVGNGKVWRCRDMECDETVIVHSMPVEVLAWRSGADGGA
jgi:hypothetical protein